MVPKVGADPGVGPEAGLEGYEVEAARSHVGHVEHDLQTTNVMRTSSAQFSTGAKGPLFMV